MLLLVFLVREEDFIQVDRAARDVDRLQSVDERLVEALDVVVVWRTDNRGKGRLGLREEIFSVLGGGHGFDREGSVPTAGETGRERSGERGYQAVVSVVEGVCRFIKLVNTIEARHG